MEGDRLLILVTNCLGLLIQVQSLSEAPVSRAVVDAALDPLAEALMPRCEGNMPLYTQIQAQIASLKEQLCGTVDCGAVIEHA